MILEDIRQLKTGQRELRNFGLLVGGVFIGLGILFLLRGKPAYPWMLFPGLSLVALGLLLPSFLKYVYIAWMSLAFVLGFVVSHLLLTVFFFLVITPIGLAARIAGKDFLRLKLDRQAKSYWIPRPHAEPHTPANYERQF